MYKDKFFNKKTNATGYTCTVKLYTFGSRLSDELALIVNRPTTECFNKMYPI